MMSYIKCFAIHDALLQALLHTSEKVWKAFKHLRNLFDKEVKSLFVVIFAFIC